MSLSVLEMVTDKFQDMILIFGFVFVSFSVNAQMNRRNKALRHCQCALLKFSELFCEKDVEVS